MRAAGETGQEALSPISPAFFTREKRPWWGGMTLLPSSQRTVLGGVAGFALLHSRDSSCSDVGAGTVVSVLVEMNYSPAGICPTVIFSCNAICHFHQCGWVGSEIKREKLNELTNTNINL